MGRSSWKSLRWPSVAVLGLLFAVSSAACSDASQWRTTMLGSGFPELALELNVHGGELITEAGLRGSITLLYFGYMSCPDVCPTTMATLSAAVAELPETQRTQVNVLFVSVDPERDDLQRLADYAAHFGPQFIGATGGVAALKQLTSRYGSSFQPERRKDGNGYYLVTHGSHVLAFDREGRARLLIRHDDSVEAIAHDLRQLLSS
jgi:protein SCO1